MTPDTSKNNDIDNVVSDLNYDSPEKSAEQFESGMHRPRSIVVLVGIWMLMGLSALICGFFVVGAIISVITDGISEIKGAVGELLFLFFLLAMFILSIGVLFNATKRYRSRSSFARVLTDI